jgi:hypothetical protein
MNNRKSLIFVLPLIALVLMSCRVSGVSFNRESVRGSGDVITETREVSNVERVSLEGIGDLEIVQGDTEGLTIEIDDNLLEYLEIEMRGRELVLGFRDGVSVQDDFTLNYTLSVKSLDRVQVSGAGNVTATSLETGDLALEITGSGNVTIEELAAEDLSVRVSGSGNLDLAGEAASEELTITGAGNFTGGDLRTGRASIRISGAGNVTTWAEEELDVTITGFGSVSYYGKPAVSQNISGSGEIKGLGEK